MQKVLVLGSGIAGMAASLALKKQYGSEIDICILEKTSHPGGLLLGSNLKGYAIDNGCYMYRWDSSLAQLYPENFRDASFTWRVWLNKRIIAFPPNYHTILQPQALTTKVLAILHMLWGRVIANIFPPLNAREWLYQSLGRKMIELTHLDIYLNKLQGRDASTIHPYLCDNRIDSLRQPLWQIFKRQFLVKFLTQPKTPSKSITCYPKGGTKALINNLYEECLTKGIAFVFDCSIKQISTQESGFVVQTADQSYASEQLYSSIPLAEILSYLPNDPILQAFPIPQYTTMHAHKLLLKTINFASDIYVLYSFEEKHLWKRCTCVRQEDGYYTAVVEVNLALSLDPNSKESLRQNIIAELANEIKLFDIQDLIADEMITVANAYPVIGVESWEQIISLKNYLEEHYHFKLMGRQGIHDYLSSVQSWEQAVKRVHNR